MFGVILFTHCDVVVVFSLGAVLSTIAIMFNDMFTRSMYDTKHAKKSWVAIKALIGMSPKRMHY